MNLKCIMLSERSQTWKIRLMIPLLYYSEKGKTIGMKNRLVVTGVQWGKGGGD